MMIKNTNNVLSSILVILIFTSCTIIPSLSAAALKRGGGGRPTKVISNTGPTDAYQQTLAETFILMAYNSYCVQSEILDWSCTNCQKLPQVTVGQVIYSNSTDTQAYVATYSNEYVYVAFRGSMDIESWITNLQFLQETYPGVPDALVHSGFYNAYKSVQQQVQVALQNAVKACPTCKQLYVIGHSLGGALASLCMADVVQWFPSMYTESYTFGSPRVGNAYWVSYYNSIQPNNYRIVNQDDLVPHVPPKGIIPIYDHVPTEVWYKSNATENYKICDDSGEDPTCSDSVNPLFFSIYDHLHYFDQHCCC
ncbi:Triacylglycerol lipase-like protein triacylglycerol lipase [Cavenderia fasciculata]|uniref:Triacylglycerol lipase-like protein triacylglycerol lipase n=1 Tax=Cavenderia fasciculata TaxID=261658 RepID=F4PWA6_CACFS|nr:Triacylglycerol lipase-like protein triacylglycerol lipase [Cavenderia fasciculata]EGG20270.1 Triacylglycerol lipase-like protein triacylglycerol lipase [Cavenderia fasciculata]|eukprot:XP_004367253.1 Triacylglycerol lipase-like protein triacylglycerol lipase [Cavenderia fasciculata]